MIVMFRIVEDDMPPLPEGASSLLKDFLRQCFQKDPKMRPDAEMLCEHEWLKQNWAAGKVRPHDHDRLCVLTSDSVCVFSRIFAPRIAYRSCAV